MNKMQKKSSYIQTL